MKRLATVILLFLISITTFNIQANETEIKEFRAFYLDIMNSSVSVSVDSTNDTSTYRRDIEKILHKYSYLSHIWFSNMTIDQLNVYEQGKQLVDIKVSLDDINNNPNTKIEVSPELYEMLENAENLRLETDGYFDYSIGKIIDLWKEGINNYPKQEMPSAEFRKLTNAVNQIEIEETPIILTNEENRYYVEIPATVKLDLGAFAKGYATQKVVDYLKEKGEKNYLINSGESSIVVGEKNNGNSYEIGLREPSNQGNKLYASVNAKNESITTSGDSNQYFLYNNQRFHHIISPKNKAPSSNYHMVTIVGQDADILDAYSTAIFSMSLEEAKTHLNDIGATAIFYHTDGTVTKLSEIFDVVSTTDQKPLGRYIILAIFVIISASLLVGLVYYFIKNKRDTSKGFLKRDLVLFMTLVLIFGGGFILYKVWPRNLPEFAEISYRNEVYVKVDFKNQITTIIKDQEDGYPFVFEDDHIVEIRLLGDYKINQIPQEVVIEVDFRNYKIRVSDEKSPYNLCSKQGWSNSGYIVCLPNSITINFITDRIVDGVV